MTSTVHSVHSSYREMLLEHMFVGEVLRYLWTNGCVHAEVLKPQVDDSGYDLVMECRSIIRHVQLKSSYADARRASVDVHLQLAKKPSGCVIWIFFDPDTLTLGPFLWFGGAPGSPLPSVREFRAARHTKADATGRKGQRPNLRVVPKGQFDKLATIADVVDRLFGVDGTG